MKAERSLEDILGIISPSEEQDTSYIRFLQNALPLEQKAPAVLSASKRVLSCQASKKKKNPKNFITSLRNNQRFYSVGAGSKSKQTGDQNSCLDLG